MYVGYLWEDEGIAGVSIIECDCGYHYDAKKDDFIVHGDDGRENSRWKCPKCQRTIQFKWGGMMYNIISPSLP
jgi:transposase-like protein